MSSGSDPEAFTHLHSTLRNTTLELDQALSEELRQLAAGNLRDDAKLVRAGFVMPQGANEIEALFLEWKRASTTPGGPEFTIAPTMACNFGCEYCFESHTKGVMARDVREQLLGFMAVELRRVSNEKPTGAHITWFGGEPLMGLPVIREVMKRLPEVASRAEREVTWSSTIISNGYLMTEKVAEESVALGVDRLQITLDGPPRLHNRSRFLKVSGKPTFSTIIENVRTLPKAMSLQIRMNVQRNNAEGIIPLFEALEAEDVLHRLMVSLAPVESFVEGPVPVTMYRTTEFSVLLRDALRVASNKGWPLSLAGLDRKAYQGVCQVDSPNSWAIDWDGTLRKCWAEMGTEGGKLGTIQSALEGVQPSVSHLAQRDPFDDSDCRSCVFLPACLGGCPKTRATRRAGGQKECPSWKYHYEDLVRARTSEKKHAIS